MAAQLVINIDKRTSGLALVEQRAIQTISIAVDKGPDSLSQQSAPVVVGVQRLNALAVGLGQHRAVQIIGVTLSNVGGVFLRQHISKSVVGIGSRTGGRGNGRTALTAAGVRLGDVLGKGIAAC